MFPHLSTCCNLFLRSITTQSLDAQSSTDRGICPTCGRIIDFDYRVVQGLGGTSTHGISAASYSLHECCEATVQTNENDPPDEGYIDCTCGEKIFFNTSLMSVGEPPDAYSYPIISRAYYGPKT